MIVSRRQARRSAQSGFTLVELIVALVIGAAAAGATALTLSNIARARDGARARAVAFDRAQSAADRIAADALTIVRDHDLYFTRFVLIDSEQAGAARDELLMMTALARPTAVSAVQAEADFGEVQYRLVDASSAGPSTTSSFSANASRFPVLWRRVDSTPDDVQEGGGIASPVVPGILSVSIEAADSESWYDEWDSDYDGLPHLIRITVTATDDQERSERTYRRTVALDRVPLVGASISEQEAQEGEEATDSTSGGSTTGSGTSSGQGGSSGSGSSGGSSSGGGTRGGGAVRPGGSATPGGGGSGGTR